jgi:chemotaxis protein MotB
LSRKQVTEESAQTPLWIITFSDMTTNLLTFFVLLVSMGTVRDETLGDQGKALTFLGNVKLGFGFSERISFDGLKIKHHISGRDELPDGRTIDAKEEDLRRTLEQLQKSSTVIARKPPSEKSIFSVVNVHFSAGSAELDGKSRQFLSEFYRDLQQSISGTPGTIYVLGLAGDVQVQQQQWLLSARRAEVVAQFLRNNLAPANHRKKPDSTLDETADSWNIYSWGAGAGGEWAESDGTMSNHSQILISVQRQGS